MLQLLSTMVTGSSGVQGRGALCARHHIQLMMLTWFALTCEFMCPLRAGTMVFPMVVAIKHLMNNVQCMQLYIGRIIRAVHVLQIRNWPVNESTRLALGQVGYTCYFGDPNNQPHIQFIYVSWTSRTLRVVLYCWPTRPQTRW